MLISKYFSRNASRVYIAFFVKNQNVSGFDAWNPERIQRKTADFKQTTRVDWNWLLRIMIRFLREDLKSNSSRLVVFIFQFMTMKKTQKITICIFTSIVSLACAQRYWIRRLSTKILVTICNGIKGEKDILLHNILICFSAKLQSNSLLKKY